MVKINVLVTGSGGGGIGEQIVKSLRNGKNSYHIICTDTRQVTIAKKLGDDFLILPFASDNNYIEDLITCCLNKYVQVLIPGSEPELIKIASNINRFKELNIFVPINSIELINLCSNKLKFNIFLEQHNFNTCETYLLDDQFNYSSLRNYPYVVKPYKGSGSANVFIVQSESELKNILSYLGLENQFILQQYVGNLENEYTVGVLSTPVSGYIDHIILRRDLSFGLSLKQKVKNNSNNPAFGNELGISTGISQGTFENNSLINETVIELINLIKPISSINIQCRIFNNKVYIFEVNPRFSGTSNLRAMVGFNEPEYLINSYFNINNNRISTSFDWSDKTVLRGLQEYLI